MFIFTIETVLTTALVAVFILVKLYMSITHWIKHRNCKHENYRETMSCDAVCSDCGKNLGFIGTVRGDK